MLVWVFFCRRGCQEVLFQCLNPEKSIRMQRAVTNSRESTRTLSSMSTRGPEDPSHNGSLGS